MKLETAITTTRAAEKPFLSFAKLAATTWRDIATGIQSGNAIGVACGGIAWVAHTPERCPPLQRKKRITTNLNTNVAITLRNDSSRICEVHVVLPRSVASCEPIEINCPWSQCILDVNTMQQIADKAAQMSRFADSQKNGLAIAYLKSARPRYPNGQVMRLAYIHPCTNATGQKEGDSSKVMVKSS